MSQAPSADLSAADGSEKSARDAPPPRSATTAKPRSCVVCRSRKVRCDKLSPCSNCRRANIACVLPSADRPPRWARRLDRANLAAAASSSSNPQQTSSQPPASDSGGAVHVMDRLQKLEGLVKDLSSQLEQAQAAVPVNSGSPSANSTGSSTRREAENWGESPPAHPGSSATRQSGKLLVQNADRSRYISSDFWSRINDEVIRLFSPPVPSFGADSPLQLTALRMDTTHLPDEDSESSDDEMSPENSLPTDELQRTPSDRNAFIFGHNISSSPYSTTDLHPLPSQVSYLLDVYSENVNFMAQAVHMPSVSKLAREMRSKGTSSLTPSNEALLFAIYYAAITSMEEEDVKANFGASKSDLNHRFRVGFETAVAKADFLNAPNLTLVQAFIAFLCLARRHDSPRYVWMMVGIVIRMAQSIGLHRDGTHFPNLSPFEVEVRRRAWWALYMLDLRCSEDQGTDLTINHDGFDTKTPLNINDTDIQPGMKEPPSPAAASRIRQNDGAPVQGRHTGHGPPQPIVERHVGEVRSELGISITRLVMAKLKLLVFVPLILSPSSSSSSFPPEHFSDEIRTSLFVAAIEVAEYNHSMNENAAFIPYRWIFQTYTHWHSIVYLLIEMTRLPWSALVERAWVALHSKWLMPVNAFKMDKNKEISMPLKKLLARARRHRTAELERLRVDPAAARVLEEEDERRMAVPASSGSCPPGVNAIRAFRELWRQTLASPNLDNQQAGSRYATQADSHTSDLGDLTAGHLASTSTVPGLGFGIDFAQSHIEPNPGTMGGHDPQAFSPSWLWADMDPYTDVFGNLEGSPGDTGMDLDHDMNWSDWVQSAKHMERNAGPGI
ncbi:fungal-specific transcription factor domain-containing protein [Apiospora arundinis]